MSNDAIRNLWNGAILDCVYGHDDCTFGGMIIPHGYWLAAEGCTRNHGDTCTWCPAEATDMFRGRVGETLTGELYAVPSCHPCALRWASLNPDGWTV